MILFNIILLALCAFFILADIVLALCIGFSLPLHITDSGWYAATNDDVYFLDAVQMCPCLSKIFPTGTKNRIQFSKISYNIKKRSVNEIANDLLMQTYTFLVSVSFLDNEGNSPVFECNGLILSSEWFLTFKFCISKYSDWSNLIVRSDSPYWSSFGKKHMVTEVRDVSNTDFVKVKVLPHFENKTIPSTPITYNFTDKWIYAVSLGWNKKATKYKKSHLFESKEWTSVNPSTRPRNICFNANKPIKPSKFLLTSCHQLIGIESEDTDECDGFFAVTNKFTTNKNKFLIYEDTGLLTNLETCNA